MRSGKQRRGFFLVLVLIVIVIATLAVNSFTSLMIAYDDSAYLTGDIVQARVTAESGAESIRLMLAQPRASRIDFGGVFNNPNMMRAVTVSTGLDGQSLCNFSVIAPNLDELGMYGGLRYGLQNESAKLNVNALTVIEENWSGLARLVEATGMAGSDVEGMAEEATTDSIAALLLIGLPGMTTEIANAIMDWLDADDIPREGGFEFDYYTTLPTPYEPTNGPIQSVEELLLVEGVTPTLLFGADSNRNGILDPDEQQRFNVTIDTPGALGWAAYMTVHSAEANKTNEGELRIYINQDDLELLAEQLAPLENEDYTSYILAYRIAGQSQIQTQAAGATGNTPTIAGIWTADLLEEFDLSGGGGTKFNQVLDLIGSTVTIGRGDNARTYASPFASDLISMEIYLPIIMDWLTTQATDVMPGRINLNECPVEILAGMSLLTEEQIEAIIEEREVDSDDPNMQFETWPMARGIVTQSQMSQLLPLLTAGGDIYRAQIIGYHETNGLSHRCDVVIDATTVNPKIISWRDLSHLGRGFDLSVLGINSNLELATGTQ